MALLMGLLARLATLILVLAVLGRRLLLVAAVVTGEGTVGVKAVVEEDGWRCLDANWGLGETLVWFWFGLVGSGMGSGWDGILSLSGWLQEPFG